MQQHTAALKPEQAWADYPACSATRPHLVQVGSRRSVLLRGLSLQAPLEVPASLLKLDPQLALSLHQSLVQPGRQDALVLGPGQEIRWPPADLGLGLYEALILRLQLLQNAAA